MCECECVCVCVCVCCYSSLIGLVFLIGVQLTNNLMLISGMQHCNLIFLYITK